LKIRSFTEKTPLVISSLENKEKNKMKDIEQEQKQEQEQEQEQKQEQKQEQEQEQNINTYLGNHITTYDSSKNDICEVEFNLEEISELDSIQLKKRNDVYYEIYREARRKAKIARDLALSAYLEAKRIKNTYMLDNLKESDESDNDFDEEYEDSDIDAEDIKNIDDEE
jgi:hypothetical protein